jgi:hypothetical protein
VTEGARARPSRARLFGNRYKEQHMNDYGDFSPSALLNRPSEGEPPRARRTQHKLTEAQKDYVIRRLAAYDSPGEIQRDLHEKLGVEITRQGIEQYDPTRSPACGKESAELFFSARGALLQQSEPPVTTRKDEIRRRERIVLRAIETLADRILKSIDAGTRDVFAKRADRISDDDRLRALQDFATRLKTTNPAGFAALRTALLDEPQPAPGDAAPAASAAQDDPDEAQHAE